MARIGIDALTVSPDGKGHSRTQRQTIAALAGAELGHELIAFVRSEAAAALVDRSDVEAVVVGSRRAVSWEQVGLPRAARARRLDVVLTWTERLPLKMRAPVVVWLFESPIHRIAENRRSRAGAYQRGSDLITLALWKRSLRRAAHVAMGSHATADEVLADLPELETRSSVVYPGLGDGFGPGPGRQGGRYIFHLGSSDPRDNSEVVVAAFGLALRRLASPTRLVIAGRLGERYARIVDAALTAGVEDHIELTGRVSDDELVYLYRGAAVYVDPTLYEGFGYGVLEAMACGAPVVASSTTSIPEVVGDAGLLCDPRNPEEFADALVRVLEDEAFAADLRGLGLERARAFTWSQAAVGLSAALEAALEA